MASKPFCSYPFEHLHIHVDGNLYMCCYQRMIPIGNILEQSFESIWYGSVAQDIREKIIASELPAACLGGGCPYAHQGRYKSSPVETVNLPNTFFIYLPNTHCNIGGTQPTDKSPACIMCERDAPGYVFDKVNRLPEILPLLRPYMKHVQQVHVQGIAEAFWKDAIFEVLDLLDYDSHKDHVYVTTVTNGILLNKDRLTQFLNRVPKVGVAWSLDAATPETYQKIRRLNVFDKICENIKEYSNLKSTRGNMEFKIQHNINTLNVHEVVEMVRFAHLVKAEILEFNVTGSTGHIDHILVNQENCHVFKEAQIKIEEEAKKLDVHTVFLAPLDLNLSKSNSAQI
ncbi:MAG: SPASM domain-containing protein [Bdellovibrionaceae bacterium]|nr:SPASM domain-containing protein [Pseudobdellovibrionaceae bacterium]